MPARCERAASLPGAGPGQPPLFPASFAWVGARPGGHSMYIRWTGLIRQVQPREDFWKCHNCLEILGEMALWFWVELGQLCHRQLAFLADQKEPSSRFKVCRQTWVPWVWF